MNKVLSWDEVRLASIIGCRRNLSSLEKKQKHLAGMANWDGWSAHIEGACAELAVSKIMGITWDCHVDEYKRKQGDVGGWEVRSSKPQFAKLRINPNDDDDKQYLLVIGTAPTYRVAGWVYGYEAKRPEWFTTFKKGRDKEFFVDPHNLREWHGDSARDAAQNDKRN